MTGALNKQQFDNLNDGRYNRLPVWRTVLADLDTPLSVFLKLADGPDSFLFESVEGGETWGRYSIIGLPCRERFTINGHTLARFELGRQVSEETLDDPLAAIDELRERVSRAGPGGTARVQRRPGGLLRLRDRGAAGAAPGRQ